jgi:hypothetical protein
MLIKGQSDIEIHISDMGYITLKQRVDAEGDNVIQFAPAYAPKVMAAIGQLQDFAQKKFEKSDLVDD